MDVFIYWEGQVPELGGRDEVEDALEEALEDYGGEGTGSGAGEMGGNLDLFVANPPDVRLLLRVIATVLNSFHFPAGTEIHCGSDVYILSQI